MLEQQYTELAELAGGFIHEIKNHVSTLGLNLQLLAEDFENPETQRERRALERIQRLQGESVSHILNVCETADPPFAGGLRWNATPDDGRPKPVSWFQASLRFAMPLLAISGPVIYVHCYNGIDRSAAARCSGGERPRSDRSAARRDSGGPRALGDRVRATRCETLAGAEALTLSPFP